MSHNYSRSLSQRVLDKLTRSQSDDAFNQFIHRLDALNERLDTLAQPSPTETSSLSDDQISMLQTTLAGVEKQLMRSGREQLKVNATVEAQQEQLRTTLEQLEAADARREDALAELQARAMERETAARLSVVQRIMPAIDGLDEALRAGEALLAQPVAERTRTRLERLLLVSASASSPEEQRLRDAVRAWLHGLTFVRQRLLDTLRAEQVRPIAALGEPFDPELHVALHAVPADAGTEPGTVVAELRRGYTVGDRVLRHAEVAVAQEGVSKI